MNVFCVGWHLVVSHKYKSNSLAAVSHINKSNAAGNSKKVEHPWYKAFSPAMSDPRASKGSVRPKLSFAVVKYPVYRQHVLILKILNLTFLLQLTFSATVSRLLQL